MNRRDFLKGTAWMGAAAFAGGFVRPLFAGEAGGKMAFWADKPFAKLRVGVVGLGRGHVALWNMPMIPGCEITAICDITPIRVQRALTMVAQAGQKRVPKVYDASPEEWKKLCDDPNVDLVWNATPWELHVPIALYAMRAGKHVAVEVPAAFTIDECWELVETSEKLQRHCMQLENCCYGEMEMLCLNLCRKGMLGDLVHGEGAYIHDLRGHNYAKWDPKTGYAWDIPGGAYWNHWRLKHNIAHKGNQYPTHGLGPICQYMNVNRGDRFDYLVSLESNQFNFEQYAQRNWHKDWRPEAKVAMGDMNITLIKTKGGRSIMVQHDISSPRPYSRINTVSGTRGIFADYPYRVGWEPADKRGSGVHSFFDEKKAEEVRQEYKHPLWKDHGELAAKQGGHGGMDFMMTLRLAYCLRLGLPLDQNVYDLASWCSLCELTEKSVRSGSMPQQIPDFTRGAWQTTAPLGIESADLAKMGLEG